MTVPSAQELTAYHDAVLGGEALAPPFDNALWQAIEDNHRNNRLLWDEEDQARRLHAAPEEIVANKRAIDRYNQARNDATERLDELLLTELDPHQRQPGRLHSETLGAIHDRLSILALKIFNMRKQLLRSDVDAQHIERCKAKATVLERQRSDLSHCFDMLISECIDARAHFRIYRQFKMYNDPALNPLINRPERTSE